MYPSAAEQFRQMDRLSLEKTPFFFLISFNMEKVEIHPVSDLNKIGLLIDFQIFSNTKEEHKLDKKVEWKSFPETLESFKTGFDKVQKNIRLGNSYLVNYTRKTEINTNLSLEQIFTFSKALDSGKASSSETQIQSELSV